MDESLNKYIISDDVFNMSKYDKKKDIITLSNITKDNFSENYLHYRVNNIRISSHVFKDIFDKNDDDLRFIASYIYKAVVCLKKNKNKPFVDGISFAISYDVLYRGSYENKVAINITRITVRFRDIPIEKTFKLSNIAFSESGYIERYKSSLYQYNNVSFDMVRVMMHRCKKYTDNECLLKRCSFMSKITDICKSNVSLVNSVIVFECVSMFMSCVIYKILDRNGLVDLIKDYYINGIDDDYPYMYDANKSILSILNENVVLNDNEKKILSCITTYMSKRIDDLLYKSQVLDAISFCKMPLPGLSLFGFESDDKFRNIITTFDDALKRITTLSNRF
jgi:hypothetical protein|nr:MAG TPA: hypothetical protein [Caudoviricetes sp.]